MYGHIWKYVKLSAPSPKSAVLQSAAIMSNTSNPPDDRGFEDRLRADKVGIFLSGGLDSGALAVTAKEIATSRSGVPILSSYTMGLRCPNSRDDEGIYASKVARHLDIPNKYLALDQSNCLKTGNIQEYRFPEPNVVFYFEFILRHEQKMT
jgi:asparagine synthetase B (glutamine-hydrolysing)